MTGESGASTTILEIHGLANSLPPMSDGSRPLVTDEVVEFQKIIPG